MVDRKGFLFTVTVFLVLMYILLTISVWVKGVETSERAFAEFYKESTVELAIEQITPAKMDNITYIIMNRNLARLNDITIDHPVLDAGPQEPETENIRAALEELLMEGAADTAYFKGSGGDIGEVENTSMKAWASNLNASLHAIGVYMSAFEVSNFEVNQSDIDKVNYSFDVTLELKDYTNTSSVSRTYEIENEIDISGLVDPALARETEMKAGEDLMVYRQFFFNKEDFGSHLQIDVDKMSASVDGGQGFLYGPLATASGGSETVPAWHEIALSSRKQYILVGNYTEIKDDVGKAVYNQFGGFILTNPLPPSISCGESEGDTFNPVVKSPLPDCEAEFGSPQTELPFIVAPGFNPETAPDCPILNIEDKYGKCVLFVNTYLPDEVKDSPERKWQTQGSGLYELEEIRDFVMCGYYTGNPDAPSYLQRLLNDSYSRKSPMGIETFVIGNYASKYSVYDLNSRLDRELLDGNISGIKIRGLPGCKNFYSCSIEGDIITGIFAASAGAITDYDMGEIKCPSGGCDK